MTDVGVSPACGVHYREPRGTHRRMADAKMLSPGPGSYNPLKPFGSGVFTTNMDGFCSRHMAHEQVNVRAMNAWSPGPACYLPHYGASSEKTNAVSCRIAGAVRNCHEVPSGGTSPGPAAYRLEINNYKPSPPSTRFGKEERITGLPRKGGPGPGAYKPLSCKPLGVSGINGFTKSTPMVNGRPMQYPNNNPPPNKYNPKNNFQTLCPRRVASPPSLSRRVSRPYKECGDC